jgi:hypothetical protein
VEGILVRSKIGLHLADDSTFNTIFDFLWVSRWLLSPWVLLAQVNPKDYDWKGAGALSSNHYFLERESTTFFFCPFLP